MGRCQWFWGALRGARVDGAWTHLQCEGSEGKVLRIDRPDGRRVLKFDGLSGRGLRIALMGNAYEVSVTGLLSVSYDIVSILVISRFAAPPYPAAPDFLHGKACHTILRSLCSLTNRVPLPPHLGDRINRSMLSCRNMAPRLSIHSAPACGGKVVAPATKGGMHFRRPQVGCKGFIIRGRLL